MPSTARTGEATVQSVEEQFCELICSDAELLAAEFDAIIAAEWPDPPADTPRPRGPPTGAPVVGSPPRSRPRPPPGIGDQTAAARHRRMGTAALTPAATTEPATGRKAGDRHT
jgi:hypothetical protein